MDFLDLQCVITAAEELNFTRAAQRLYISQQSLSARIGKLEQYYGTKLFERTTPLRLTAAGNLFTDRAREMMRFQSCVDEEMRQIQNVKKEHLTIGVLANRGTAVIQLLLPELHTCKRQIFLNAIELTDEDFASALYSKRVDLAIGYQVDPHLAAFLPLFTEDYYLLIPHNIFEQMLSAEVKTEIRTKKSIQISDFIHCPFIANRQITWVKKVLEACCKEAGIAPQIEAETSSVLTRLSLCLSGAGIMVTSTALLALFGQMLDSKQWDKLFVAKIADKPQTIYQKLGVNYLRKKKLQPIEQSFLEVARRAAARSTTSC